MVLERNFLRADTGIFQQNEVPMKKIPLKRIFAAAALVCCLTVTTAYADVTQEDIDNAKYYSQQAKKYADEAQQIVGGNFIPNSEKGIAGGVAVLNANLAVEKAVADENGNNIQETYAKKTEIGEIIEVDSKLSATSTNPVQNKIVTAAINRASQQAGIANGKLEQW